MRVLAVALADQTQRFERGYPPKGARLFLTPNPEIGRLARLVRGGDDLTYVDLRTAPLEFAGDPQLVLVQAELGQEEVLRDVARETARRGIPHVLFGPLVTAGTDAIPGDRAAACSLVIGDITDVWPQVRSDAAAGRLLPAYRASPSPRYHPPLRPFGHWPEMNTTAQATRFMVGCCCPPAVSSWCRDHLYYGRERLRRGRDDIIGEVLSMPGKHVTLDDDDVAAEPEYYEEVFSSVRHYRRYWTVRAGTGLFRRPGLVRLLAKSGVRMVFLNEGFLEGWLDTAVVDRRRLRALYRCVKSLQAARMLVGARVLIRFDPDRAPDFETLAAFLRRIDLDFIEPRFLVPDGAAGWRPQRFGYRPMLSNREPGWLSNRFYGMSSILDRLARRPRRTGFFSTARYLLPYTLAYRQEFLEGMTE